MDKLRTQVNGKWGKWRNPGSVKNIQVCEAIEIKETITLSQLKESFPKEYKKLTTININEPVKKFFDYLDTVITNK